MLVQSHSTHRAIVRVLRVHAYPSSIIKYFSRFSHVKCSRAWWSQGSIPSSPHPLTRGAIMAGMEFSSRHSSSPTVITRIRPTTPTTTPTTKASSMMKKTKTHQHTFRNNRVNKYAFKNRFILKKKKHEPPFFTLLHRRRCTPSRHQRTLMLSYPACCIKGANDSRTARLLCSSPAQGHHVVRVGLRVRRFRETSDNISRFVVHVHAQLQGEEEQVRRAKKNGRHTVKTKKWARGGGGGGGVEEEGGRRRIGYRKCRSFASILRGYTGTLIPRAPYT